MKTSLLAIAAAILLSCAPSFAQSTAPTQSLDPVVVAATRQLIVTMKLRNTLATFAQRAKQEAPKQIKEAIIVAINGNPDLNKQQKADALKKTDESINGTYARIQSVLSDPGLPDELITELVPLYAETFTLEELHQLNEFYASPVGQKMVAMTPALMSRSAEICNRVLLARIQKILVQDAQVAAMPATAIQ